jgi:uncharacterized protein (TIGR02444 family)
MSESNYETTDNPFWDFSLDFYGRARVAEACLKLQDSFGADVNIVLYCCWVAFEGAEKMEQAELFEIISAIEPWQSGVVQRLRHIRRDMKQDEKINLGELSEQLRETIKKCELDGERIEQTILYQSGQREFSYPDTTIEEKSHTAETNMLKYLAIILGDRSEDGKKTVQLISQALIS